VYRPIKKIEVLLTKCGSCIEINNTHHAEYFERQTFGNMKNSCILKQWIQPIRQRMYATFPYVFFIKSACNVCTFAGSVVRTPYDDMIGTDTQSRRHRLQGA